MRHRRRGRGRRGDGRERGEQGERRPGGREPPGRERPDFASLPATYPFRPLTLETAATTEPRTAIARRVIDLVAPLGFGQRALIVAPSKAGKTILLQAIAEGIVVNHPQARLYILLVDERPEEVSEMVDWGKGEVIASSFDRPAAAHVEAAAALLARAHAEVTAGRDLVIVLDSITRLARGHNTVERGSGRTLSGGVGAEALQAPRAFFGAARQVPAAAESGGGSLTIIATALVETGSRMDDLIFEEFKGTGNSEIRLSRELADRRIYPAIDVSASGTRREELLIPAERLEAVQRLRRQLVEMRSADAMNLLLDFVRRYGTNAELLSAVR
ncbi:MAG: transcription termination factor Rho [Gemmatimonadetes bacterium]|nr:transcription termination factor Rho [Gemmatimonadota bacterium]